jgi:hypothetical protein
MVETPQNPAHPGGADLQATIRKIEELAKAQLPKIKPLSDWTAKFEPIEVETDKFVRQLIEEFPGKSDELISIIKGRRERLSLSSGITSQIVSICQQMLQARFRYPSLYFENIGNAWPFFYYATITPVARAPIQSASQRFVAAAAYAKDFASFSERVLKEEPKERLRAELQQYFLLMSYQGYVHQFSLRLASIFIYGFTGAVCTAVLMFVAFGGGLL